tara:strand:- start:33576 stop:37487 length:3912 start_codon:yes stop_codon:yes gene_type:complete
MRKITLTILMLVFAAFSWQANAQCTNAPSGQWPGSAVTLSSASTPAVNITTCAFTGEYSVLNITDVGEYQFTSSTATNFLTVTDAGLNPVAFGVTPLNVDILATGTYRLYRHDDAGCTTTATGCRTITGEYVAAIVVGDPPQIVCPLDITVNTSDFPGDDCGAQVFFADAQAFDPEDGLIPVTQTMGPGSGSIFPVGDTIIEFSATDSDGNTSTCQFTVTVLDDVDPVAVCQDITVELDENGVVTIFADELNFGAGAPDPATPISCGGNPGPTSAFDTNMVSFNIVGENFTEVDFNNPCPGVTGLQDQTALSVDLVPGEEYTAELVLWTCGFSQFTANANVWIDFNGDGELTADERILLGSQPGVSGGGPTGGSPTGGTTLTANFTVPASADAGSVIIRAMVQETATAELDPCASYTWGSMADFTANLVVAGQGSSDLCGPVSFSFDEDGLVTSLELDCSNLGDNTITVYVTDEGGNVVSCESIVTVEDNIAPEIVCIGAGGLMIVSEDFEAGLPAGWSAVTNSGPCDWENGDLPWAAYQFGSNGMIFNDDACGSGAAASNVTLLSDVYDTSNATSIDLTYDVAYRHLGSSSFTVEVFDGSTWQNVATYNANTNTTTEGPFDLLAFANSNFQVRYTYDDGGGSWAWGAGVDNFLLEYETPAGVIPQYFLDMNGEVTVPITDLYTSATDNCSVVVSAGGATGGTPEVLTTGFAGGNGNFGNFFDINALETITINSFDLNLDTGANLDIEIYFKEGTWVGSQTTPGDWTLIGTAPGTVSAGDGVPTVLDLDLGQTIAAGETGAFYITAPVLTGGGFNYTNGTGTGNIWASDDNIEFLEGGAVGGYFTGTLFQPRVFNGNIHYSAGSGGGSTGDLTFTCADLGIVNVTVTATDSSGNTTSCTSQIEIIDNIAPIASAEDITVELGEDGTVCIEPEDLFGLVPPVFEVITISSDNGSLAVGFTDLLVDVTEDVTISFDWSYTTLDGPGFDSFGYLINGVYTELTDPSGANNQTGNETIALVAGQEFGFRSQSEDGLFGPATTTISNFDPGFFGQFDPANWSEVLTNSDGSAEFVEVSPGSSSTFDNCEITVSAIDISCFTCADIGTPVTVTLFVSDASGNIASTTAVVTVVDVMGPAIVCPEDQTVDTDPDSITYTVPDYFGEGLASVTDNCTDPVTIISQDPAPGDLLLDGTYTVTLTAEDEYGNVSTCEFELTVETILGNDDNVLSDAIVMYPNPAEAYVSIKNNSQIGLTQATIYDINGKLVSQVDLSLMSGEQRIDVSGLSSGVYMVNIQSETASVVKRLIKK